jgi:hypothetical protein
MSFNRYIALETMHQHTNKTSVRQSSGHQLSASRGLQDSPALKTRAAKTSPFFGHWYGRSAEINGGKPRRSLASAVVSVVTVIPG